MMLSGDTKANSNLFDRHENRALEPRFFSFHELAGLGHPNDPLSAIRSKCLECCGGSPGEVRKCGIYKCALWPMRMKYNPFHAKSKHSQNKEIAPAAYKQTEAVEISKQKEISANVYTKS